MPSDWICLRTRLDILRIPVEAMDDEAIAGPQHGRQLSFSATQMNDQTTLNA